MPRLWGTEVLPSAKSGISPQPQRRLSFFSNHTHFNAVTTMAAAGSYYELYRGSRYYLAKLFVKAALLTVDL